MVRKLLLGAAITAALAAAPQPAAATPIITCVTPVNLNGWATGSFLNCGTAGGTATETFVKGPCPPPIGVGSLNFNTHCCGTQSAQIATGLFNGKKLACITTLNYCTYVKTWNCQQAPYLEMAICRGCKCHVKDQVFFEPFYSTACNSKSHTCCTPAQPKVQLNTWQNYSLVGCGKFGRVWGAAPCAPDNVFDFFGPGSDAKSFACYVAEFPCATIEPGVKGLCGINLISGCASSCNVFNTNVDGFTIGFTGGPTTEFNFDPATTVPELDPIDWRAAAAALGGLLLLATDSFRRLRGRRPSTASAKGRSTAAAGRAG